jgi:hypothetical protein
VPLTQLPTATASILYHDRDVENWTFEYFYYSLEELCHLLWMDWHLDGGKSCRVERVEDTTSVLTPFESERMNRSNRRIRDANTTIKQHVATKTKLIRLLYEYLDMHYCVYYGRYVLCLSGPLLCRFRKRSIGLDSQFYALE